MFPERDLWLAVLTQAFLDLAGGAATCVTARDRPELQRRARAWFSSKQESLYSFPWICNTVGLDADCFRDRLFRLPALDFKLRTKTVVPFGSRRGRRRREPPRREVRHHSPIPARASVVL